MLQYFSSSNILEAAPMKMAQKEEPVKVIKVTPMKMGPKEELSNTGNGWD